MGVQIHNAVFINSLVFCSLDLAKLFYLYIYIYIYCYSQLILLKKKKYYLKWWTYTKRKHLIIVWSFSPDGFLEYLTLIGGPISRVIG